RRGGQQMDRDGTAAVGALEANAGIPLRLHGRCPARPPGSPAVMIRERPVEGPDHGVEQYLRELDDLVTRGVLPMLGEWSLLRPSLAADLPLLAQAVAGTTTILDAGCGQGWHACFLARRGHTVVGVDEWHRAISFAT